jgi:hypothetical protein
MSLEQIFASCSYTSMRFRNTDRRQQTPCYAKISWLCRDRVRKSWCHFSRRHAFRRCFRDIYDLTMNLRPCEPSALSSKHFHNGKIIIPILFPIACKCATAALHCLSFSNSYTAGYAAAPSLPTSSSTKPKRSLPRSRPCSVPSSLTLYQSPDRLSACRCSALGWWHSYHWRRAFCARKSCRG